MRKRTRKYEIIYNLELFTHKCLQQSANIFHNSILREYISYFSEVKLMLSIKHKDRVQTSEYACRIELRYKDKRKIKKRM